MDKKTDKTLVAYFSATGTTARAARALALAAGADLYEIRPEVPYTDADLDWRDSSSRNYVEMHDPDFRPAIVDDAFDVAPYDLLLVGYPVWWHTCPQAVNAFLERYDLSGKKVVLWQTSGGSGFENALADATASVSEATAIVEGRNLNGQLDEAELAKWVDALRGVGCESERT